MLSGKEGIMPAIVEVSIPVDPDAAVSLADSARRESVGRIVSRMLKPGPGLLPLVEAIERLKTDAQARGLTDEIVDQELAAYNAGS